GVLLLPVGLGEAARDPAAAQRLHDDELVVEVDVAGGEAGQVGAIEVEVAVDVEHRVVARRGVVEYQGEGGDAVPDFRRGRVGGQRGGADRAVARLHGAADRAAGGHDGADRAGAAERAAAQGDAVHGEAD